MIPPRKKRATARILWELRILSDGRWHAMLDLAKTCGVSTRTIRWDMQVLTAVGFFVERDVVDHDAAKNPVTAFMLLSPPRAKRVLKWQEAS